MPENRLEGLESIFEARIASVEPGHRDWVGILQSPVILRGIGPVSEEQLQESLVPLQIRRVVDPSFLNSVAEWDDRKTPSEFTELLVKRFGWEDLENWHKTNKVRVVTDTKRVLAVKEAIARALEERERQ